MIIDIRGTSGSGKSSIVHRLLGNVTKTVGGLLVLGPTVLARKTSDWKPYYKEGRRQPLYYLSCNRTNNVAILGHYETVCGGVDTLCGKGINSQFTYDLAAKLSKSYHVIMEGIISSEQYGRVSTLAQTHPVNVLYLTTSIPDCLEAIRQRRLVAGNDKELNPTNTTVREKRILSAVRRLEADGVKIHRCNRDAAWNLVQRLIAKPV